MKLEIIYGRKFITPFLFDCRIPWGYFELHASSRGFGDKLVFDWPVLFSSLLNYTIQPSRLITEELAPASRDVHTDEPVSHQLRSHASQR
jgi:hypothetical protein